MTKKIYRICLIISLILVIVAGLFYYQKCKENKVDKDDSILVYQPQDESENIEAAKVLLQEVSA